jgi:hypothetical protein
MEAPPRYPSSLPLGQAPTECYYARSRGGIPTRLPHREHPLATKSIRSRQNADPRLPSAPRRAGKPGRVVETAGRRVLVADTEGARMCFLGGHRALVGDTVTWEDAPGEGGKIICVDPRKTVLRRIDPRGDEQLLAANLRGVLVVASVSDPPFHGPLIDRYIVAAEADDLEVGIVLTKFDTGTSAQVESEIDARAALGIPVLRTSATDGVGLEAVRAFLNDHPGPWALVGHSGSARPRSFKPCFHTMTWGRSDPFPNTGGPANTRPRARGCFASNPTARSSTHLESGDLSPHFSILRWCGTTFPAWKPSSAITGIACTGSARRGARPKAKSPLCSLNRTVASSRRPSRSAPALVPERQASPATANRGSCGPSNSITSTWWCRR